MKNKWLALFIAAILAVTAAASAAGTEADPYREVIEQTAVPMAMANDTGAGLNIEFSAEELAGLVRALNEHGIVLEENNALMQAVQNDAGYFEEEVMMEICRQAFGGYYYTWTLEDQDWYEKLLAKIGFHETPEIRMPGADDMTYEEAEAFAFRMIREEYGRELPLEDRTVWKLEREFWRGDPEDPDSASWYFELLPLDVEQASYSVSFEDRDPEGTYSVFADIPDWTAPYTAEDLMMKFNRVYAWNGGRWPREAWQRLHEMMQEAVLDPEDTDYPEYLAYRLTAYPEPAEGEISREEAIRIAKEALQQDRAALDSALLTEYEGSRVWMIGMGIYIWTDRQDEKDAATWAVAVDSRTGEAVSIRNGNYFTAFVHPAAYEKAMEGLLEESEYLRIAAEAVREKYPEINPLDETEYEIRSNRLRGYAHEFNFITKNVQHGDAAVTVSADGTVSEVTADLTKPTGDTLFSRYWKVCGYFGAWGQETWVQLGRDIQALDAEETEGQALKLTRYPEESSVRIQHAEAQELAIQAAGSRMAEVNTCVLVDADPNPVWIMRVIVYDGREEDPVIGIDAETGSVVFTEQYLVDETPHYVLFSMPETWRTLRSAYDTAMKAVVLTYADHTTEDPEVDVYNTEDWEMKQDGLTVRFTGRWKGMKAYEVELDGKGNVLRCERSESPSEEEKPEEGGWVPEPLPTPQPDGKPWIWGNSFAPEAYWNQLSETMEKAGVTFENLEARIFDWYGEYGWYGDSDWPQELFLIRFVLTEMRPEDLEHNPVDYPVFPDPEKKTKEEIEEIALKAYREAAEPIKGSEWVDRLNMLGILWSNGIYEYYGIDWQKPAWRVNFLELETCWEDKGFVMLDEDGNVLTVQVEPYGGG